MFTIPIEAIQPHPIYTMKLCFKVSYDSDF
jgi:hypothetical protein